jgi:hypothetical protein
MARVVRLPSIRPRGDEERDVSSSTTTTRTPGLLYFMMGLPAVFSLQYVPAAFIVPGDAAATARRITEGALTYRIGILCDLVSNVGFLLLALSLYSVFKDVDRKQARLLLSLVLVSVAVGLANEVHQIAPLILLGGADFHSAFTKPQLDALVLASLRLRSSGLAIDSALWGLWLFPFGILVIKSGFLPKLLGACLIIGGMGYLATCVTSIVIPDYRHVVSLVALPLYAIGEVPIALWLIVKGVRAQPPEERPSHVS